MSRSRSASRRGFTLVELLVVLGIIALLVALLMPAVMYGINITRRTRMSVEIANLAEAIEAYKTKVGDYPPNFRDTNAVIRHIRTRYPKIAPSEFNAVFDTSVNPPVVRPAMQLDEGESLVFWLAGTRIDSQFPFGLTGGQNSAFQIYYAFDQRRLVDLDLNTTYTGDTTYTLNGYPSIPSYRAAYARETFYLYIDSRSYDELTSNFADPENGAYAEMDGFTSVITDHSLVTRPYATDQVTPVVPMNATSFQILCAGQDGDWGNVDPAGNYATALKHFPGGLNYFPADRDNLANFSNGKMLEDSIP